MLSPVLRPYKALDAGGVERIQKLVAEPGHDPGGVEVMGLASRHCSISASWSPKREFNPRFPGTGRAPQHSAIRA